MRLSSLSDDELRQLAVEHLKRSKGATTPRIMETQIQMVSVFQELLDRREEDAQRVRSAPAIKLAIAHVEMLRDAALANKQTAAVACLDMQLSLLKEFDL